MQKNRLPVLLEDLNRMGRAIKAIKMCKQNKGTPAKLASANHMMNSYLYRLVNFGKKFCIVRVTIHKIATKEYEYAFYTDISIEDAQQLIETQCNQIEPRTHEFVVAEYVNLGHNILEDKKV